jgi:hypothetical protein
VIKRPSSGKIDVKIITLDSPRSFFRVAICALICSSATAEIGSPERTTSLFSISNPLARSCSDMFDDVLSLLFDDWIVASCDRRS